MTHILDESIISLVERLGRFWLLGRRSLVKELQDKLEAAQALHRKITEAFEKEIKKTLASAEQAKIGLIQQLEQTKDQYQQKEAQLQRELREADSLLQQERQSFESKFNVAQSESKEIREHLEKEIEKAQARAGQVKVGLMQQLEQTKDQYQQHEAQLQRKLREADTLLQRERLDFESKINVAQSEYREFREKLEREIEEILVNSAKAKREFTEQLEQSEALFQKHEARLQRELEECRAAFDQERFDLKSRYTRLELRQEEIANDLARSKVSHLELVGRYDLISSLLAAKPDKNHGVVKFKELLNIDFLNFANEESSLAEEAKALLQLQAIEKELELVSGFPSIYSKNIIAVAGGFSSGKSEFINSFIQDNNIALTVDINPCTAIPAYVISSNSSTIKGYSAAGGAVNLSVSEYQKISHEYLKSFGFDLKEIMPYISIGTPLKREWFQHICFIDTPGYNPSQGDDYAQDDKDTAYRYAKQSQALLWLVDIKNNGTVPASDLKFIQELELNENTALYIVANQADVRADSDIEEILDEFQDVLEDAGIVYQGISAYSSVLKEEKSFRIQSLEEFFLDNNKVIAIKDRLLASLEDVFDGYIEAIDADILKAETIQNGLKSLQLDILRGGEPDLYQTMKASFDQLDDHFGTAHLHAHKSKAKRIRKEMIDVIESVMSEAKASLG